MRYVFDTRRRKDYTAVELIKWCRRNFGDRGVGWDFILVGGKIELDIRTDKFKTMYELWFE